MYAIFVNPVDEFISCSSMPLFHYNYSLLLLTLTLYERSNSVCRVSNVDSTCTVHVSYCREYLIPFTSFYGSRNACSSWSTSVCDVNGQCMDHCLREYS